MLMQLQVKDFAVASHVQLDFRAGFSAVTGETGAGKSLLVDALLCLSGTRADAGMVRHGAERAELFAEFCLSDAPLAALWLRENDCDEDNACHIRRVIRADGGSKAWINGRNATLSQLQELCSGLLEIHGQHEQQNLLQRRQQLQLLDEFAQHHALLKPVRESYQRWQVIHNELEEVQQRGDVSEQVRYLQEQLAELQQHSLEPEFILQAVAKHKRHHQSAQLKMACQVSLALLDGEENSSASNQLRASCVQLAKWSESEPTLSDAQNLLESAQLQVREAALLIEHLQDQMELDESEILVLENQLSYWHEMSRKHRVSLDQLLDKSHSLELQIHALSDANARVERLQNQLRLESELWQTSAHALRASRENARLRLGAQVSELMSELGMLGGQFKIQLTANENALPQSFGSERCEFMVSANPGQPVRSLRKVASGGELARISLAIEVATLGMDATPTMIFDEVDSGIGGAIAEVVGQKLRALGKQCQVLCVTHLAQVASLAHLHYCVQKRTDAENTESHVQLLDYAQRINEIARMLGGLSQSEQSLAHAEHMLKTAET